ncbi:CRTAC1 family protein [Candidatus Poribacteria bacterium]|nr:CRTAC1 family protein [Candidatus Poribacteria bacterium]
MRSHFTLRPDQIGRQAYHASRFTFYTIRHTPYAIGFMVFWLSGFSVDAQLRFTEVTAQAGIHCHHQDGRSGEKYYLETPGSGAAWFDYDRDGDLDLYFVNGADLPTPPNPSLLREGKPFVPIRSGGKRRGGAGVRAPPRNALYRNNGDGTFTDVTFEAGVGDTGYGLGCCVGDYDNDGFLDLYITNFGPNVLYHNNGDGTFTDVTAQAGVGDERWGTGAAFADYDKDGDLDLFVANYVEYQLENNPVCFWVSSRVSGASEVLGGKSLALERSEGSAFFSPLLVRFRIYCLPANFVGAPDVLYRNNGDGTFTDVTQEAGLFNPDGKGLGVVWGDYNNDGYLDIFVANDTTPNMLYKNNGDGTFTDMAHFAGVALGEKGIPLSGMGVSFGDDDNDGWLDLVVTNFEDDPNSLYHNNKDGTFADATYPSGVGGPSIPYLAWGVDFVDLDNDGYQDIFVANGHIDDNVEAFNPKSTYAQQNQVFRNRGDGTFGEISNQCGPGLLLKKVSRGAAFGDYDNDGDIDILITNSNQTPDLLRNDSVNQNHWLILETVGTVSNRDGLGARVKVVAGGISQIREVKSGSSYLCQSDMRLHFGLGDASVADLVEIRWPSGTVERFEGVKADQFLKAKEGEGLTVVLNLNEEDSR